MKRPSRKIIALLLTLIYILITYIPLAPLALRSAYLAHAITGECSGNCDLCECSAERRASHSCCCWLKKLKHEQAKKDVPECCRKKQNKTPMLTCNSPCGTKRLHGLPGTEKTEVLLYRFSEEIVALYEEPIFLSHWKRLIDRHGDPPDPPPKLIRIP